MLTSDAVTFRAINLCFGRYGRLYGYCWRAPTATPPHSDSGVTQGRGSRHGNLVGGLPSPRRGALGPAYRSASASSPADEDLDLLVFPLGHRPGSGPRDAPRRGLPGHAGLSCGPAQGTPAKRGTATPQVSQVQEGIYWVRTAVQEYAQGRVGHTVSAGLGDVPPPRIGCSLVAALPGWLPIPIPQGAG